MLHSEQPKFDYNKKFGEIPDGTSKGVEGGSAIKEVTFQSMSKSVMEAKYPSSMKRSP